MTGVMPVDLLEKSFLKSQIDEIRKQARARAEQLIGGKIIERDLRPRDLGLDSDEWTFNLSAGENSILPSGFQLDDKTLIVIYGFYNLSDTPVTTGAKLGTSAGIKELIYLEDMYLYDHPISVLTDESGNIKALIFRPGSAPVIQLIAKGANSSEKFGFKGFVFEPDGRNVSRG